VGGLSFCRSSLAAAQQSGEKAFVQAYKNQDWRASGLRSWIAQFARAAEETQKYCESCQGKELAELVYLAGYKDPFETFWIDDRGKEFVKLAQPIAANIRVAVWHSRHIAQDILSLKTALEASKPSG